MLSNVLKVTYLTLLQATKSTLFFQCMSGECYHFPLGNMLAIMGLGMEA